MKALQIVGFSSLVRSHGGHSFDRQTHNTAASSISLAAGGLVVFEGMAWRKSRSPFSFRSMINFDDLKRSPDFAQA